MKSVLLDTNVLIALEDTGRVLDESLANLVLLASGRYQFFIHPKQYRDLNRDSNVGRRKLLLSRIKQFHVLEAAPEGTKDFFLSIGWKCSNENDLVDNCLLLSVKRNAVDYLLTEDKGLLRRASREGYGNRVVGVDEFVDRYGAQPESPDLAYVADVPCYSLSLDDRFFDSLRRDYPTFDNWFNTQCAPSQRRAWVIRHNGAIGALCIYKLEEPHIIDDKGFNPNVLMLKLCTFKVAPELQGSKVGERLLHAALEYAKNATAEFIYLTVYVRRQPHLTNFVSSFGFVAYGAVGGEVVFGKHLKPHSPDDFYLKKNEFVARFYPSYRCDESVNKFIVPIQPLYHERLFPDISDFRESLLGDCPELYTSESNTIRKAYVSKSRIRLIEPGDLLLFYRSHDRQSLEILDCVESIRVSSSIDELFEYVHSRTVYSLQELKDMSNNGRDELLAIQFVLLENFSVAVDRDELDKIHIAAPQSIRRISSAQFAEIIRIGHGK